MVNNVTVCLNAEMLPQGYGVAIFWPAHWTTGMAECDPNRRSAGAVVIAHSEFDTLAAIIGWPIVDLVNQEDSNE